MTLVGHYAFCWKHIYLSKLTMKIWMQIDLLLQRWKRSSMTPVSGNIRFMFILARVLCKGASKRQWGSDSFQCYILCTLRNEATIVTYCYLVFFHPSTPQPPYINWNYSDWVEWPFYVISLSLWSALQFRLLLKPVTHAPETGTVLDTCTCVG